MYEKPTLRPVSPMIDLACCTSGAHCAAPPAPPPPPDCPSWYPSVRVEDGALKVCTPISKDYTFNDRVAGYNADTSGLPVQGALVDHIDRTIAEPFRDLDVCFGFCN